MKTESADFQEMFGSSTVRESLDMITPMIAKAEPELPMDTDPFWLESATGGRSAERVSDESFIKEISGCESIFGTGTAQPATQAGLYLLKLVQAANARNAMNKRARASGLTRRDISARMGKHYSHGLWREWESMMAACIGDAEFDEQKALSYLR